MAGGSASSCAGLAETLLPCTARSADGGRYWGRLAGRRLLKLAPKAATPKEPPIERKNVEEDVATPSWLRGTAFCTATTSTCMTPPMPTPRTTMYSDETTSEVDGVSRENRKRPRPTTAVPRTGKILYLPHLVTSRPLMMNVTSIPPTSGSSCSPELGGVAAGTGCRESGMEMIGPNITKPTRKPIELDTENPEIRNTPSGRTGSAARSSTQQNRPHSARA